MMISKISVDKLFGVFDHNIPLNLANNMTIIHGPNGLGKTIILKMIHDLFELELDIFHKLPFNEFSIEFDNSCKLWVETVGEEQFLLNGEEVTRNKLKVLYKDIVGNILTYNPSTSLNEKIIRNYKAHGISTKLDYDIDIDQLDMYERHNVYSEKESTSKRKKIYLENKRFKKDISDLKTSLKIHFIETQRLLNPKMRIIQTRLLHKDDREETRTSWVVDEYSRELAGTIKTKLAESASLTQSLDQSFPRRLVEEYKSENSTYEEIEAFLGLLENKRNRLIDAGILEEEKDDEFHELKFLHKLEQLDEARNVLAVYISDVMKKLNFYDDLLIKIELLKKIINGRFLYKRLNVNKKTGFEFVPTYGEKKSLKASDLSSGEQHELVLIYQLLFKVSPNSLVMIDEPELSLHVGWQMKFLEDLSEITKHTKFQILIATHSPEIIDDKWDLTVRLGGPKVE